MPQQLEYNLDMKPKSSWKIISADTLSKQSLLYLQETGKFYCGPSFYTNRKDLDSYLVKLTLSGKGSLTYKGADYALQPGDVFWIQCNDYQSYKTADTAGNWDVLWVHFYGSFAHNYYTLFQQLNQDNPVIHLRNDSAVKSLLSQLLDLYQESSSAIITDIQSNDLLSQLLSVMLESAANPNAPKIPNVICGIKDYLQEHYPEAITLDTLAESFNLSKYHMQRIFRKHIGLSPAEYLQKIRITKAKELLRSTDMSVNLVAYHVGIESTSHFITVFKKQEGITPLKYRTTWSGNGQTNR